MQEQSRANQPVTDPKEIGIVLLKAMNNINEDRDNLTVSTRNLMQRSEQLLQAYADQVNSTLALAKRLENCNNELAKAYDDIKAIKAELEDSKSEAKSSPETEMEQGLN